MDIIKNITRHITPITVILLLSPFILYAITLLLPTFDDWTYYTTPYFGTLTLNNLLPERSWWRPFDVIFGWVLGRDYRLFPLLNHIFVYAGHLVSTFLIYKLSGTLSFGKTARNTATIFFFISPGMLGTVLSIDSLNQTYAQMWGLLGLWFYLHKGHRPKYALWILCTYMSTFSKENGIMFFFIPQVMAFGFGRTCRQQFVRDSIIGATAAAAYLPARFSLTPHDVNFNEEYFDNTIFSKLKHIGTFIGMTWVAVDYVSLVHAPSRNPAVVVATLLLSMPFMAYLFAGRRGRIVQRPLLSLAACMCMAALPHLLTLFTVMHTYAGLGMAALIVAFLADRSRRPAALRILFTLYVISSIFIDIHHWHKAYRSGLMGQDMGRQAIEKTGHPVDKAYSISVRDDEKKYSSFCVLPSDAFGWGHAAFAATGYKWPRVFGDTAIHVTDMHLVDSIADHAVKEGYDKVWLVHGDTVDVIR